MILGFILIPLQQLLIWDKQSNSILQKQNAYHSFFLPVTITTTHDKGVSGVGAASQLCETVTKAIKKLNSHRVLFSEIPQVQNGHYGRESNIIEIEEFNKQLRKISLDLNGTLKWTRVEFFKCNFKTSKISNDSVHLNLAGVQKIFNSIRKYYHQHNISVSLNSFALRQLQRFYSILWLCDFEFFVRKK